MTVTAMLTPSSIGIIASSDAAWYVGSGSTGGSAAVATPCAGATAAAADVPGACSASTASTAARARTAADLGRTRLLW